MNGPRKDDLHDELRAVLGSMEDTDFDHDALIAGAKQRAGRIRRRRALAQGVTAAVLAPTLVAAGWLIGTNLGGTGLVPEMAGTTRTQEPDGAAAVVVVTEEAPATEDVSLTEGPVVDPGPPPYQQVPPPQPLDPGEPGPLPNRVQIPDARPTGIDLLDELGAPQQVLDDAPRLVPLDTFTGPLSEGERDPAGEAHSGISWMFYDGTNEFRQTTVTITITAWDDSEAAMHAVRTDEPTEMANGFIRWVPRPDDPDDVAPQRVAPVPEPWSGHEDEDHLLVLAPDHVQDMDLAGALIRQGDYLVGVTVQDFTEDGALAAAAQIAEQTAANLAHLDAARAVPGGGR